MSIRSSAAPRETFARVPPVTSEREVSRRNRAVTRANGAWCTESQSVFLPCLLQSARNPVITPRSVSEWIGCGRERDTGPTHEVNSSAVLLLVSVAVHMSGKLVILSGPFCGETVALSGVATTIGRDGDNQL